MKRRYSKELIEELEEAIEAEIARTKDLRDSSFVIDLERGRESAEVLLTLSQAWSFLTQRGVE